MLTSQDMEDLMATMRAMVVLLLGLQILEVGAGGLLLTPWWLFYEISQVCFIPHAV